MRIRIVCPEHDAYEGEAAFVVLPCSDGEMGILPEHASEICTTDPGYVRICDERMGEVSRRFAVGAGYAEITATEVIILAERAFDLAELDEDAVKAELGDFEDKLSNLPEDDVHRAYLYNEIAWRKLLLAGERS